MCEPSIPTIAVTVNFIQNCDKNWIKTSSFSSKKILTQSLFPHLAIVVELVQLVKLVQLAELRCHHSHWLLLAELWVGAGQIALLSVQCMGAKPSEWHSGGDPQSLQAVT